MHMFLCKAVSPVFFRLGSATAKGRGKVVGGKGRDWEKINKTD